MTYRDVAETCNQGYPQSAMIMTEGNGQPLPHLLIQYQESDWDFIKRVASSLHTILVPSYKTKGVKYFFGAPDKGIITEFKPNSYKIQQNGAEYELKKHHGVSVSVWDAISYIIESREVYELGDQVSFDGKELIIWKIESQMIRNELIHIYYLKTRSALGVPSQYNRDLIGLSLSGTVYGVKGEDVEISIDGDENQKESGHRWIPFSTVYSSEDGTGWYCMPEEGDTVHLYFPTEDESYAYVTSAVHKNRGTGLRTNPDEKIWRNKEGKEIRLSPDKILITNNNGMSIRLDDQSGIKIDSDKSITLSAEDNINICSSNANLEMSASSCVVLQQGDTKMEIDDGIHLTGARVKLE